MWNPYAFVPSEQFVLEFRLVSRDHETFRWNEDVVITFSGSTYDTFLRNEFMVLMDTVEASPFD
jgi:hypothetical protein